MGTRAENVAGMMKNSCLKGSRSGLIVGTILSIKTVTLAIALSLDATTLAAESIVVPSQYQSVPGPVGFSFPLRGSGTRLQQIYMSSAFSEASGDELEVTEVRFRMDERYAVGTPFSTVAHGLSITMSTTSR